MSYRALVTIREGDNSRDFTVNMGDGMEEGEKFAHILAEQRTYNGALVFGGQALLVHKVWASDFARQQWLNTYADQAWEVRYAPDGDEFCLVTITGKDACGTDIFMRRTLYHTGD